MITNTQSSPRSLYVSPGIRDVSWTDGFWKNLSDLCAHVVVPDMLHKLRDPELSHCWTNFLIAAGHQEGAHQGPPFHDGDFYKWLEAACYVSAEHSVPELVDFIDQAVHLISEIQEDDGYVFTRRAIDRRNGGDALPPLSVEINFEVYNLGHLMTAGCVHHRVFGTRELLDVAEKAASYLDGVFAAISPEYAKTAVCPSHYMGLAELHRTTGNEKWRRLLERLIALRDKVVGGTDDNQDRLPLMDHREIIGHAVRANYLYAGVADMVLEGGPVEYMPVLEAVWQDLVHRKIYITGGCGALYDGVSPYGSWEHDDIQRVHQAYGRAYELPNVTAYNETCASIGGYLWNWRMFLLTGESRFIDLMERILYNGALAGISLDGRRYFYSNTLRRYRRLPFGLKWSRQREEYISSFCCPPNLARTLAETRAYAYAVSRDRETPGISVLLYGSSRATLEIPGGAGIELAQRTDYPWDGRIALEMESLDGPSRFGLSLRIPEWVGKFECRINGRPVSSSVSGNGFLTLHRNWQAGDRIDLDLPLDVALMESHPMVEETRNHLCVVRGPLVYCLESADLPAGLPMDRIGISRSTTLHPERETIGDQSMTVLRGDLPVASPVNNRGESDRLYHPATVGDTSLQSLRFIPYFAWDNRGFGEMTVWLPVR